MSKFMKLAIVVLVLGVAFTAYKVSRKSGNDVATTEPVQNPANQDSKSADGKEGDDSKSDNQNVATGSANNKDEVSPVRSMPVIGKVVDGKLVTEPTSATGSTGTTGVNGQNSGTKNSAQNAPGTGGANLSGANGTAGVNGTAPATGAAGTGSSAVPAKPDNNCFAFEYKHQKEALNKDIEDFLDYSNAFPVLHDKVTEKSICVKVNGKPTAFKLSKYKDQKEIVIGSVVGPDSLIRVSYCVGTSACKEACAIKSNRFMDDLMSDAGDEDEFKESWGEAKEQKKELQAKVKEFRNVASENKDLQKQSTIRNWDTVQQSESVCKNAPNGAGKKEK